MATKYEFKTEPYQHQRKALALSWNKEYFAWLMGYGTGKTKVAIDNAGILFQQKLIRALFVIAPNGVHEQWIEEQVPEHLPDFIPYTSHIWQGKSTKKYMQEVYRFWATTPNKLMIFTMNVEALQFKKSKAFLLFQNFLAEFDTLLIVDESTRIKTPGAVRTKQIIQAGQKAKFRRILTGNEITRSPFDIYSQFEFLHKGFWRQNFHSFQNRYAEYKRNTARIKQLKTQSNCPFCKRTIRCSVRRLSEMVFFNCPLCNKIIRDPYLPPEAKKVLHKDGLYEYPTLIKYKNLEQLRSRIEPHAFRVRKRDCLDLPPKIYSHLYCKMNSEQARIYKEMKDELFTTYNDVELTIPNKIALSVRFQQVVGGFFPESGDPIGDKNPKIEALFYDLEDYDSDDPIIVWSRFTAEINALWEAFRLRLPDWKVAKYYGETPRAERTEILNKFKEGKIQVLIGNPATAGTGLNLQRSHLHYYFSNSFKAEDRWQSEDRSHRSGQKHPCLYKDIFVKGTIDDTVKKSNQEKKNFAEFFKEGALHDLL